MTFRGRYIRLPHGYCFSKEVLVFLASESDNITLKAKRIKMAIYE